MGRSGAGLFTAFHWAISSFSPCALCVRAVLLAVLGVMVVVVVVKALR